MTIALWNHSVKKAKERLNIDKSVFIRIQGKLLREAQVIYHLLITKPSPRVKSKKSKK
jgi:hypothetical protein